MLPPSACRTSRASARRIVSCRGLCASSLCPKSHMRPLQHFGSFRQITSGAVRPTLPLLDPLPNKSFALELRAPQKEVGKRSSITFFVFGTLSVTFWSLFLTLLSLFSSLLMQISGRNFLPKRCGEVHPQTVPLQALSYALRSTEQSTS